MGLVKNGSPCRGGSQPSPRHPLRKVRWSAKGQGKRSGIETIYHWFVAADVIFFLDVFAKNEKSDLTKSQLKELANLIGEEQRR